MDTRIGRFIYTSNNIKKEYTFDKSLANDDFKLIYQTSTQNDEQRINVKIIPNIKMEINHLSLEMNVNLTPADIVFLNGYQTWTESREFSMSEKLIKPSRLIRSVNNAYGDYTFIPTSNDNLHSWTYTYIRKIDGIVLLGSLSEASGYTTFLYSKKMALNIIKDCSGLVIDKEYLAFDIFIIAGEENHAFSRYFTAMGLPKSKEKYATGWTSWYNYYTKITQEIILENLSAFKSNNIPLDIFQIDDGYQEAVGDWLRINKKFPDGMKSLAHEIKKCHYKAGLWLAPFICEKKSEIFKNHPKWIVKKAGFNLDWSGTFYVLDFYNEEVRNYLRKVFSVILLEWGYDMVKLDFLYAVALIKRKDKTRGQVMYEAMEFLKEIIGDKIILGCGVPLGCAFGFVDYCRVGSDVALQWEDILLKSLNCRERVSTINSITNTIGRRHLNGFAFLNDPDVFILRSRNNKLTKNQRYTLLLINLIFGGLIFTSDNINEYTEEEMIIYKSIFKLKERNVEKVGNNGVLKIYFSIEDNKYLTLCNLKNKEVSFSMEEGTYFCRKIGFIKKDETIKFQPYESICLMIIGLAENIE